MSTIQGSNLPKSYEDFEPKKEIKDTTESIQLVVHLPGFAKEHIGARYESAFRRVSVFGEKPVENNKWKRFNVEYQIPETCDVDKLRGQFQEGAIITISIPKKPISTDQSAPKEEEPKKPIQEEAAKQVTPSKSSSEDTETTDKSITKTESGISQEPQKSTMESQRESDEKKVESPTAPEKVTEESKAPQKDQEKIPQKVTTDDEKQKGNEKKETNKETSTSPDTSLMPQKDQLETKKEDDGKTSQKKAEDSVETKERKEERKEATKVVADESSGALKTTEKEKKEEMMNGKSSELRMANGIRNMANSASQAVTKMANRFSEEDKQKLIYAGAAILVVAVGIYASFKLRFSSSRS